MLQIWYVLHDSSEPLELVRREQILLFLEAAVWGRVHFFMLRTNLYPWLGLTKAERVQEMYNYIFKKKNLKKKNIRKHFCITAPCIRYLNFLFKKDLKPQCFKIKSEKKKGCFSFICFSLCLLFNSWLSWTTINDTHSHKMFPLSFL